ncbi:MAG TPA: glycerophosphodiester phosphodiesterase family protein, partial [Rhodothermales bacterium]
MSSSSRGTRALIVIAAGIGIGLGLYNAPVLWAEVQLRTGLGLPERSAEPMMIVAHRGDLDQYPEDTLEAILAAANAGADGVEFDVHRSASGTWWVIHDPTLDATTTSTGRIAGLPDEAIASSLIDGGFGFNPARHGGLHPSRLTDVLAALRDSSVELFIDMQHAESGDVAEILTVLAGRPATILCRNADDARGVTLARANVGAYARLFVDPEPYLAGWLVEAHSELTPEWAASTTLPFVTYV